MLTSKYHVSTDSGRAILFYWGVLFISMVPISLQTTSSETAILKVHNDITLNMNNGKVTALTLLNLSAAFDASNHTILMDHLSLWNGVSGVVGRDQVHLSG